MRQNKNTPEDQNMINATITEITNDFVVVTDENGTPHNLNHYGLPGHVIDQGVGTPVNLITETIGYGPGTTTYATEVK